MVRTLIIFIGHKENSVFTTIWMMLLMPRKSLMGSGNSPRINFRMDEEVEKILQQTKDKSRFIREAIVYYWEQSGNRDLNPTEFIPREEPIKPNKPETEGNSTWKAPWLSG